MARTENLANRQSIMLAVIEASSTYYKRPSLFTVSKTVVTIHPGMQINIGGNGYISTTSKKLPISSAGTINDRVGKDVYLYACQPSSGIEPDFVLSLNSTVPSGYTASNSRKIGGMHCLCLDVDNISGHPLSGYIRGEIIPNSRWDLLHRPVSDPEGMVYIDGIGKWVDIYLTSYDGSKLASAYGATIADGASSEPFHGEKFAEYAGLCGKHLMMRDDFLVAAKGSNECTSITGSADPGTTGGHKDTAGRRMISNYGLEDCCGVLWQWTSDITSHFNSKGTSSTYQYGGLVQTAQTSSDEGAHWIDGYGWQTDGRGTSNINVDGSASLDGNSYGVFTRALVGGSCLNGTNCGSRSVLGNILSSGGIAIRACRLESEPRVVNL